MLTRKIQINRAGCELGIIISKYVIRSSPLSVNPRYFENWPITPSGEDFALMLVLRLLLRVDGYVKELSISVTLPLQGSFGAV